VYSGRRNIVANAEERVSARFETIGPPMPKVIALKPWIIGTLLARILPRRLPRSSVNVREAQENGRPTVRRIPSRTLFIAMFALFFVGTTDEASAQNKPEFRPIAEATKGFQAIDGFYKLYLNPKKHQLYAEIPSSKLKRRFLIASSIVGGSYTGWQWNDMMVYWERLDRKLLMISPEIRHRGGGSALSPVVKSTYRDRVVTTVPIVAAKGSSSFLIDLKGLLVGRSYIFLGSLGGGVDTSITKVVKSKGFPSNIELEFDLMSSGGGGFMSLFGGSSGSGLAVHYSLSDLPSTGYKPRAADDRIGYFLNAYKDFSKGEKEDTRFVRSINRWKLEKADSSLKLSPPKDPIVFYIEKTVPVKHRRYVREGILEWNNAFEKVGILGAIEVRQQTATNEFAHLDPEDVRYNFFRWITSESAFAMGPTRVHPETGQILDADIIFDDSMMRSFLEDYARMIRKSPPRTFHPQMKEFIGKYPHRHPLRRWMTRENSAASIAGATLPHHPTAPEADYPLGHPPHADGSHGIGTAKGAVIPRAIRRGSDCSFGNGMRHQFLFGLLAMQALGRSDVVGDAAEDAAAKGDAWPEEFVGQVLKEVVMHEVGHTLGLRHNFKASSWLDLSDINKDDPPAITTGSVMDYNPINIAPAGKKQGVWVTKNLGPYDFWAIEYGYTFKGDAANLAKIASRVAENGLAYATDEDTWSSDPLVNRFDMGSDPLDYVEDRLKVVEQILSKILDRTVKKGDSYSKARAAFDVLLSDYERTCGYATRFLGGNYLNRDHKGDPNERPPIQPVEAAQQRRAIDLICKKVFAADALKLSPKLLAHLGAERWNHWGTFGGSPEYSVHDTILAMQLWLLFDFLNPRVLTLISDNELRIPEDEDALTIPEVFTKLTDAIFSELSSAETKTYTNRKPFISSLRRNLQHELVGDLVDLALEDDGGASPQAARTQAAYRLGKLKKSIDSMLSRNNVILDDYTRAHLEGTSKRIEKALEASYSRDGGGGGGGGFFLFGRPAEGTAERRP
jgi:hypothetical protein